MVGKRRTSQLFNYFIQFNVGLTSEFDVSFTSCGTAVVFHDDNVDRITCGSGPVDNYTLGRLQLLNLATKHPLSDNFPEHVAVPTLEEFVGGAAAVLSCIALL